MYKWRRFKQRLTLQERLSAWAKRVEVDTAALPANSERDELITKARRAEIAAHLDDWAKSPGLRPPE